MRDIKFRTRRRRNPAISTTSTADISFILLIFFLVTTSLDTDLGLVRQLPPMPKEEQQEVMDVEREKVMQIDIAADDGISIDGKPAALADMRGMMEKFIMSMPTEHVISIHADRQSSYDRYFQVQNAMVDAYKNLRDSFCRKYFDKAYSKCSPDEQAMAIKAFPQRISEQSDTGRQQASAEGKTVKGGGR